MANEDFYKVLVKDVKLLYPRLDQPYRYNAAESRSDPCPPSAQGASYSVSWEMEQQAAHTLMDELQEWFESRRQVNSKMGPFTKVFGVKFKDDGHVVFKAKRNAQKADGTDAKPPRVVGGDKQDLEDKAIWNGSTGSVLCSAMCTRSPGDQWGVSLYLTAVQVLEPVYGGDELSDFDMVEAPKEVHVRSVAEIREAAQGATEDDDVPF